MDETSSQALSGMRDNACGFGRPIFSQKWLDCWRLLLHSPYNI